MTTTPLKIYGASDDLIEFEASFYREEFNTYTPARFEISYSDGAGTIEGFAATVEYLDNGTWGIRVEMLEEDIPMPEIRVGHTGYSVEVTAFVPEHTTIQRTS